MHWPRFSGRLNSPKASTHPPRRSVFLWVYPITQPSSCCQVFLKPCANRRQGLHCASATSRRVTTPSACSIPGGRSHHRRAAFADGQNSQSTSVSGRVRLHRSKRARRRVGAVRPQDVPRTFSPAGLAGERPIWTSRCGPGEARPEAAPCADAPAYVRSAPVDCSFRYDRDADGRRGSRIWTLARTLDPATTARAGACPVRPVVASAQRCSSCPTMVQGLHRIPLDVTACPR